MLLPTPYFSAMTLLELIFYNAYFVFDEQNFSFSLGSRHRSGVNCCWVLCHIAWLALLNAMNLCIINIQVIYKCHVKITYKCTGDYYINVM